MILMVKANRSGFREVVFTSGVNLILADRSRSAGDKDTTNALGKSTLIDIIDFCLGSNTAPGKRLRVDPLRGWTFSLVMTLAGNAVTVTRATDIPGAVSIEGDSTGWVIQPVPNKDGIPDRKSVV